LLDGDQKPRPAVAVQTSSVANAPLPNAWTVTFLPGSSSPEVIVKDACSKWGNEIARSCGVDEAALRRALTETGGLEPHDWIHELSRSLTVEPNGLMRGAIR